MSEIKIDFKASGFDKIKQETERLFAEMARGAQNYSKNSSGQNSFINQEIKLIQQRAQEERRTFEEKKKQINDLRNQYAEYHREASRLGISTEKVNADYKKDLRGILGGTGYRKENTFLAGEERRISGFETLSNGLEDLTDNMKSFFREFLIQDERQAKDLANTIINDEGESPERKLAAQQFLDSQRNKKKDDDLLGKILSVKTAMDAISYGRQFMGSTNGFDMIKPATGLAGAGAGALIGGVVGSIVPGAGTVVGAGIGAQIGSSIGEGIGEYMQRKGQVITDVQRQVLSGRAMSGITNNNLADLSGAGYSYDQFAEIRNRISPAMGKYATNDVATKVAYLERGFGVNTQLSTQLLETMRSNKGGSLGVEQTVLGLSDMLGGDRTFLPELTQRFNTFTREFLKGQNSIKDGTVASIIGSFDKIGGQFAMKDFRSEQNIMSIQSSLANPNSDNMKALSFSVLRQLNPNMGISDIITEREKGLGSQGYFQGMLQKIQQIGGGEDMMRMNIGGAFGLSGAASKTIYDNMYALQSGGMSFENLKKQNPDLFMKSEAEASTALMDKQTAYIKNGIVSGVLDSAPAIAKAFEDALYMVMGSKIIVGENGEKMLYVTSNTIKASPAASSATATGQSGGGIMYSRKGI